jgi:hypothetical protein
LAEVHLKGHRLETVQSEDPQATSSHSTEDCIIPMMVLFFIDTKYSWRAPRAIEGAHNVSHANSTKGSTKGATVQNN